MWTEAFYAAMQNGLLGIFLSISAMLFEPGIFTQAWQKITLPFLHRMVENSTIEHILYSRPLLEFLHSTNRQFCVERCLSRPMS